MFTTDSLRTVAVDGQPIRVAVRPGLAGQAGVRPVPLLVLNGIGASLELLTPFVESLDPALEVIRFDVPGVGGSPLPAAAVPVHRTVPARRPAAHRARLRRG